MISNMSVKWGGYEFTNPSKYSREIVEGKGGVYVIMAKTKIKQGKQYYKATYFGQTNNFSERLTTNHENYNCFEEQANKYNSKIYRELYFMSNSTKEKREKVESELIKQYVPPCNDIS